MNNFQPVNADRSKVEKCCGCVNMYSGFKFLALLNVFFYPLAFLACYKLLFIFMFGGVCDILLLYDSNGIDCKYYFRRNRELIDE